MAKLTPRLDLSPDERWVLEKWASYPEFPRLLTRRAPAILAFAEGKNERTISRQLRTSKETVAAWCGSFATLRLRSMCHERRGRTPPAITGAPNDDSPLVKKTLGFAPNGFRKAADYRHNGDL